MCRILVCFPLRTRSVIDTTAICALWSADIPVKSSVTLWPRVLMVFEPKWIFRLWTFLLNRRWILRLLTQRLLLGWTGTCWTTVMLVAPLGAAGAVSGGFTISTARGFGLLVPGARGSVGFGPVPAYHACQSAFHAASWSNEKLTLRSEDGAARDGRSVHEIGRSPSVSVVSSPLPLLSVQAVLSPVALNTTS